MSSHYKAFILVMAITLLGFLVARPVFLRYMSPEDFARRRNVWLGITTAAFLVPNFWLYLIVALCIIVPAARKDPNPAALYLFLLFVVPPYDATLPGFGIVNQLFPVNHFRVLSLGLLLPVWVRLSNERAAGGPPEPGGTGSLKWASTLLLAYSALTLLLLMPYESLTGSARRAFLIWIDLLLPFFVLSRAIRTREMLVEAMACFVLAMLVLAPVAAAEAVRGWLLYGGIDQNWGIYAHVTFLTRGDILRAQVTAGQAIVAGCMFAVALGFWLNLEGHIERRPLRWLGWAVLVVGLIAPFSRGPWVGAMAMVLIYLLLGPNPGSRTFKGLAILVAIGGAALVSPWGDRVIDYLPFIGTVDEGNVTYRQQLADMSMLLIQQNPFFGTPFFMQYMESLRTGEGIIDLVNTYAIVALNFGLVGATLFVGFFLAVLLNTFREVRRHAAYDREFSLLGASVMAALIGMLVIIATVSNIYGVPFLYIALAAVCVSYCRIARQEAWQPQAYEYPATLRERVAQ